MDYQSVFQEQLERLNLSGMEDILAGPLIPDEIRGNISVKQILTDMITGEEFISLENLAYVFRSMLAGQLKDVMFLGGELLIISIITGILSGMSEGIRTDGAGRTASAAALFLAAGISMSSFYEVYILCNDSVSAMTGLMTVSLPVIFGLTIASGGAAGGTVMDALLSSAVTFFSAAVLKILMPAVFISCILAIVNSIGKRDYVKRMSGLLRSSALFIMGFLITVFSGMSVIQGMMTRSADSLLMNTARYSIDNFVPVIGGFTADSLEMIMKCIGSVRNGIGIAGVVILILLLAIPLIKTVAIAAVFKITAVILEPSGNRKIADCMSDMGQSAMILASLLLLSTMMFIIFFAAVVKFAPSGISS